MVVRGTRDRLLAAVSVAALQLMPLGYGVFAVANLTNVFGQALSVITMALATVAMTAAPPAWPLIGATSAAAFVAFLSHFSTFLTLSAMLVMSALLLALRGTRDSKVFGRRLLAAFAIAFVLAVGLYYARFGSTYQSQLSRIGDELSETTPDAGAIDPRLDRGGAGTILARAASVVPTAATFFTWPFLLLAVIGAVERVRDGSADESWWLVEWGWLLGCGALLVVGLLTPVAVRHYYAAMPAVAVLAATAIVTLWRAGGQLRALATLGAGLGAAMGVNFWLTTLGEPLF
jgi:hypothetical protein